MFSLNATGSHIWRLLVEGGREGDIVDELHHRYAVGADKARAEVDRLLGELLAQGLIVELPG